MYRASRLFSSQVVLIRQLCTNNIQTGPGIEKGLKLTELASKLPKAIRADASKLSNAIKDAQVAIEESTKSGSDSYQRNHALATSRYALLLYSRLVSRAGVHFSEGGNRGELIQKIVAEPLSESSNQLSSSQLSNREQPNPEPSSSSSLSKTKNETESNESYYRVPTRDDAEAEHIVNSLNPVVRAFGPIISNMKYDLYFSRRQRVWIGWEGWF